MPYGSAGPATVSHIAGELFRHLTGVDLTPVHYKGGGAAVAALLGGEVKVSFGNVPNFLPHVGAGRIKALAVMSAKRFPGAPEVPTAAEAGLPGFEAEQWVGMLAPARTPSAIVEKLNHDMVEVLRSPAMREAMRAQGAEAAPGTPQQFTAFIASEAAKARQIIEISGVRLN
jgi:tripartite-type tricarboxylate transporter receptor subunit TctC